MLNKNNQQGYTLVELMLVITIITIMASIITPKMDRILQNAYQSKAKGNLATIRTAINMYYANHEGVWPFAGYPQGLAHYNDGLSLTGMLVPTYTATVPVPKVLDRVGTFNGISLSYDAECIAQMALTPPKDLFIVWGPADYTPLLDSPYAYDNTTGLIYYPNGNYDVRDQYIYSW
jgi:prepilin-type N-terminal cleavage/methylation domain-containing protein